MMLAQPLFQYIVARVLGVKSIYLNRRFGEESTPAESQRIDKDTKKT